MNTILMPHKLAQASYNLSLNAMRLKLLAMQELNLINYLMADALPVKVTALEWQKHFPNSENPYRDLRRGADNLREASVKFEGSDCLVRFFDKIDYSNGTGVVELHFSSEFFKSCF